MSRWTFVLKGDQWVPKEEKSPMAYPSVSMWAAHYACAWANQQEPKLGGWDWARIFKKAKAKDRELGKAASPE